MSQISLIHNKKRHNNLKKWLPWLHDSPDYAMPTLLSVHHWATVAISMASSICIHLTTTFTMILSYCCCPHAIVPAPLSHCQYSTALPPNTTITLLPSCPPLSRCPLLTTTIKMQPSCCQCCHPAIKMSLPHHYWHVNAPTKMLTSHCHNTTIQMPLSSCCCPNTIILLSQHCCPDIAILMLSSQDCQAHGAMTKLLSPCCHPRNVTLTVTTLQTTYLQINFILS